MIVAAETAMYGAIVGITVTVLAVGVVTFAMAWWTDRQRRRNEACRDRLRPGLFERLFDPEADWGEWVRALSQRERRQLRVLLEAHLRELRGTEHRRLRDLASALDIQSEARRNLERGTDRFRALTWLALLEEPVESDRLLASCGTDPRERAAAARVLYASEQPDGAAVGTRLLLAEGTRPLSAFGLDTLYRLNNGAETPLLALARTDASEWNERLLVQVLLALRYCNISDPDEALTWLVDRLDHDSPRVRAAAIGVIERHGWREQVRRRVDVESLLRDPEPAVRFDAYLLLASWGDGESAAWLRRAPDVTTDRERLALVRALSVHPGIDPSELTRFGPVADWVQAEDGVGRRRRVWGVAAAWA